MKIRYLILCPAFLVLVPATTAAQSAASGRADAIADRLTFVSESTYTAYLKGLEAFGTRHAGQPNRDSVARWIAGRFRDAGLTDVALDSFSVSGFPQYNVVATIAGTGPSGNDIVIGAHYDSQSSIHEQAPGADDNASGTAAVLEMARVLRATDYHPVRTFRFVAFGAEELGLLGSDWYAHRIPTDDRSSTLMLNFDMIGTRRQDTTDRDVHVVYYDHAIAEAGRTITTMRTYTTLTPIATTLHRPHSDSWPFATRNIPCVFYIERDFSTVYHSPHDSSNYLDMAYATEVTKAGLAMLLASDATPATSVAGSSVPDEIRLEQNYPNPFNPETRIGYRMKARGWVRLTVNNMLGQEVAVLVDGEKAAGYHKAVFSNQYSVARLPSGVYFYRMTVTTNNGQGYVGTKQMLMLK